MGGGKPQTHLEGRWSTQAPRSLAFRCERPLGDFAQGSGMTCEDSFEQTRGLEEWTAGG